MKLRFGTDGVRGRAYDELTVADAFALAKSAAAVLGADRASIAHDSRASGEDLVAGLVAGFTAAGVHCEFVGVAPTPTVAFLAGFDDSIGVMVSASHNQWQDNGIKLFAPGGHKLTDEQQSEIEALLGTEVSPDPDAPVLPLADSAVVVAERRVGEYTRNLHRSVSDSNGGLPFAGMKIVLDTANGASSHVAGPVFADLGADVTVLSHEPTGENINAMCGSTHPEALARAVLEINADLGLAFDGDADRLVAIDHTGSIVDGDAIIAICAIDLADRNELVDNTVVVTVMTNLGFRIAMAERGIEVVETAVGDRNVLEALNANGWSLGGEQSGHVIFPKLATTGDGILSGLQLCSIVARSERRLHDLSNDSMTRLPQVLENVRVSEKIPDVAEQLADDIRSIEARLGASGRVLVRPSGTEPLVRVMVEAPTQDLAQRSCRQLVERVQARFGDSTL